MSNLNHFNEPAKVRQEFDRLTAERDQLRAELERFKAAKPACITCGKPASCFGRYEDQDGDINFACKECCGCGNEDGWCYPVAQFPGVVSALAELTQLRAKVAELEKENAICKEALQLIEQTLRGGRQ